MSTAGGQKQVSLTGVLEPQFRSKISNKTTRITDQANVLKKTDHFTHRCNGTKPHKVAPGRTDGETVLTPTEARSWTPAMHPPARPKTIKTNFTDCISPGERLGNSKDPDTLQTTCVILDTGEKQQCYNQTRDAMQMR